MGVLGCPESYSWTYNFEFNEYFFSNICINSLYHGIDWTYSFVEVLYAYDFKVWYFWFSNSIFDESFDFFFFKFFFLNLIQSSYQLYFSVILDLYNQILLFKLPFNDSWFRTMISSKEYSLPLIFHPELCFININYIQNIYINFLSSFIFSLFENSTSEIFFSPIMLFPQLLLLVLFILVFINFYFSYFTNYNNDELIIDADYLTSTSSFESEKEITSYDDIILGLVILLYIFGWYFYIHCWSILNMMPELILIFYLFPGLYFIIIGIPTFLIYDFGIFFLVYLRGVGSSPVLFMELMYDYIGVVIFYTRILVQGIRLVLMLFTYASMHDLILFFSFNQKMFFSSENLWEELNDLSITLDTLSYFFLFSLPSKFIYWIYEILHTFFVVTVQFIAFFAIVFWLFLFLYTMFVIEKQENYFTEKRLLKKKKFLYILKIKNNLNIC